MKKIFQYDTYIPLGTGLYTLPITQENKKWIYLIPTASLFLRVKEIINRLEPHFAQMIEIMTFDQMMRVLTSYSHSKKMLTPSKQELIVKKAVEKVNQEKGFQYFRDSIHKNGWLHQIEIWLGEIRRANVTPEQLAVFWREHSQKYQELIWIYQTYKQLLEHYSFIDHEEPYYSFLYDVNTEISLDQYHGIVTDQFYDFSPIQMNVLNKMGNLGLDILIHLAIDEKRSDLFQWTRNTIRYLQELDFMIEKGSYEGNGEPINQTIQQLNQSLFSKFPEKIHANSKVHLFESTGIQREVEMMAAEIKSLVWNQKVPLEKIAIIISQLEQYEDSLHRVMRDSGIPIRLAKKERLIHNPFVQAILTLLKALNGQKEYWISIMLSPYFSWKKKINPQQWIMIFRECGYPISRSTWNERFEKYLVRNEGKRENLLIYNDVMQQLFDLQDQLPKKGSHEQFAQYLQKIERTLKVKEKIKHFFLQNPTDEAAFRDLKAYDQWFEIKSELAEIDQLVESEQEIPFWDWLQSLILACEQSTYEYSQGKKAGIHILKPNQIRGRQFQVVFITGLVEGEFPRAIKNDWLMPDEDRRELRQYGVFLTLSHDYEKQQKYQFFQSISAATDQIYLVYSAKTEDGKEQLRSFFIDEVLDLFQKESIDHRKQDISEVIPSHWESCTSERQMITKIYHELYQGFDPLRKKEALMRKRQYEKKDRLLWEAIDRGVEVEQRREELDSAYDGILQNPRFKSEIKEQLANKVWSTTQLNEANFCRFSYFATHLLKLSEWEEQEESLNPIEKGDLFHRILQRFFDRFRQEKEEKFSPEHYETYRKWLLDIAKEEWQLIKNQDLRFLDPVLTDLDFKRILQDVKQILEHETHWREKSSTYFYPQFLELSFGLPIEEEMLRNGEIDPSSVKEHAKVKLRERTLLLRGKIDRVDINHQGQFVVYDYKSGQAPNPKEIREADHLQLPIYLFVLETLLGFNLDQAVGVAFYTRGEKRQGERPKDNRNKGLWKSDWLEHVGLSKRMKSHVQEEDWKIWLEGVKERIEQLLGQLEQGDFGVLPNKECPTYCPYQYICRKDTERIKKKLLAREGK
ncbi:PD-(D/E)XK nuclease family protein [Tepidibacillus fermentans]|uniref:ATP-dependent helicase/DNAse subunit B n=1 Tax=Tepidibacillus fermentans TaxID=1281767 RepID=A0A4V2UT80_9BACI|nr:PD-(D/E)XK nuclease family protein [Tepidibacillus fermentans]TCS84579.1 ATP-dependent helicase/DNAse subunit B [Tepidibacillus fermentans]